MKSSLSSPLSLLGVGRAVPSASAALALAVVLAGLQRALQPPDAQLPPVAVPAGWSAAGAGALPHRWRSGGSGWATPELTALISEELWPPTLRCAVPRRRCSNRALVDVQTAGTLPRLGASGSAQRSRASGSTGNSFSAGFDASWEPDVLAACGPG